MYKQSTLHQDKQKLFKVMSRAGRQTLSVHSHICTSRGSTCAFLSPYLHSGMLSPAKLYNTVPGSFATLHTTGRCGLRLEGTTRNYLVFYTILANVKMCCACCELAVNTKCKHNMERERIVIINLFIKML